MVHMRNETTPLLPTGDAAAPSSRSFSAGKIIGAGILAAVVIFAVAGPANSALQASLGQEVDAVQSAMASYQKAQIANSQAAEAEVKAKLRYDDASKVARQAQIAYDVSRQEALAARQAATVENQLAAAAESDAESGMAYQTHNDYMISKEDLTNKEALYKNARTDSSNATSALHAAEAALVVATTNQAAAQQVVDQQQEKTDKASADAVAKEQESETLLKELQAAKEVGEESVEQARERSVKVAAAETAATAAEEDAKDQATQLAKDKSVLEEKKLETENAQTVRDNCAQDELDAKADSNKAEQDYLLAAHQHALIEVTALTEAKRAEAAISNTSRSMAQKEIEADNAEKASNNAHDVAELRAAQAQEAANTYARAQAAAAVASADLATRRDAYILAVKVAYSTSLQTAGSVHLTGAPATDSISSISSQAAGSDSGAVATPAAAGPAAGPTAA